LVAGTRVLHLIIALLLLIVVGAVLDLLATAFGYLSNAFGRLGVTEQNVVGEPSAVVSPLFYVVAVVIAVLMVFVVAFAIRQKEGE